MALDAKQFEVECKKSLEHLKKEFGRLRTGRASGSILEGIMVDYYGSQVPLNQVGMVNTPEPRLITIQVYDGSAVEAVEKAILASELGLNPSRDGNLVRLAIPQLTEDRRKDLIKRLHKLAEDAKVGIRNHRRDAIEQLKKSEKDGGVSADDLRRKQDEIQKITDRYIKDIDAAAAGKEKEVLEI